MNIGVIPEYEVTLYFKGAVSVVHSFFHYKIWKKKHTSQWQNTLCSEDTCYAVDDNTKVSFIILFLCSGPTLPIVPYKQIHFNESIMF